MNERAKRAVWWAVVAAYGAFLPYARRVWTSLFEKPSPWFNQMPLILSGALAVIVVCVLVRRRERRPSVYIALAALAVLYRYLFQLVTYPIERIHMGEYGLLTFFIVMALACYAPGFVVYPWAVVMAFHVGIIDELIQGFIEGRYYDMRDVWLNAWACCLGGCVIAFVLRPGGVCRDE